VEYCNPESRPRGGFGAWRQSVTWAFCVLPWLAAPSRLYITLHTRTFFDIRLRKLCTAPHNRTFFAVAGVWWLRNAGDGALGAIACGYQSQ